MKRIDDYTAEAQSANAARDTMLDELAEELERQERSTSTQLAEYVRRIGDLERRTGDQEERGDKFAELHAAADRRIESLEENTKTALEGVVALDNQLNRLGLEGIGMRFLEVEGKINAASASITHKVDAAVAPYGKLLDAMRAELHEVAGAVAMLKRLEAPRPNRAVLAGKVFLNGCRKALRILTMGGDL